MARELPRGGRSRARMDGLLSSAAAVEDALRRRLAFYGQLEHTRLLQLERQLDLLDGAVADEVEPLKAVYAEAYGRARTLTRELEDLRGAGRDRERELDMLRYQVGAIEAAGVEPGEDERLAVDRERARHAGKLLERTGGALALLAGESEAAALDGVRVAQRLVDEAALLDEKAGAARAAARRPHGGARRPLRPRCATTSTRSTSTRLTATHSSCATTSSRRSCASTAVPRTRCWRISRRPGRGWRHSRSSPPTKIRWWPGSRQHSKPQPPPPLV